MERASERDSTVTILLTTGWSAFVNKKKLVSGDAVLFLRGADGELRLGIRRATQVKVGGGFPVSSSEQMNHSNLKAVLSAISAKSIFSVYYKPRISSSDFLIPFKRFLRSVDHPFSVGMRFKMRYEAEDAAERRFSGVVTGLSEVDPVRWPGSKWKCLLVRWDDVETNRHSRVSPWEIEPTGPIPCSSNLVSSGLKRSRIGLPLSKPDYPIPSGMGFSSDYGEPLGSRKVLQGQEIFGFSTAYYDTSRENSNHPASSSRSCFGNPLRLPRVLQGQEMHNLSPLHSSIIHNNRQQQRDRILEGLVHVHSRHGKSRPSDTKIPHQTLCSAPTTSLQASSPSSVLMFQQASVGSAAEMQSLNAKTLLPFAADYKGPVSGSKATCRLFGVSLTEGTQCSEDRNQNEGQPYQKANCTRGSELYAVRDMLLDIAL